MLSAHSDDAYVKNATDSGAMGFLLKQTSAHEVCRAIREVQKGKTFFSPSISRRQDRIYPKSFDRTGVLKKKISELTSREMEVLQLIAEGKANKETASELGIGIKTVEKHLSLIHIYIAFRQDCLNDFHGQRGFFCHRVLRGFLALPDHFTFELQPCTFFIHDTVSDTHFEYATFFVDAVIIDLSLIHIW